MVNTRSAPPTRTRRLGSTLAAIGRLLAIAAMAMGTTVASVPTGALAADGLNGDTYTSDTYGWSVRFDARVWDATEVDERGSQGVSLSGDGTFANIVVYDDGITDAQACLDDLDRAFSSSPDWDGLAPTTRLDLPVTARDAVAQIYAGTLSLDQGTIDLALYLECREVDGATLSVTLTSIEDGYADALPDIEALLAGIDTGGGSTASTGDTPTPGSSADGPSPNGPVTRRTPTPDGGDNAPTTRRTPTPDSSDVTPKATPSADHAPDAQLGQDVDGTLADGSYRSEVGYGLTWDPASFDVVAGDAAGAGVLLENPDSGATLEVVAFEDPSIEDCIDAEVGLVLDNPDFASASQSNGVRPPTSADDAVGRMLRATEDTTRQDRKIIYVECRPLADAGQGGDPTFLVVRATSDDEDFRASRALFETVLGAITVGDAPAPAPTAAPTKKPTREATAKPTRQPTPKPRKTPTAKPGQGGDLGETDIPGGVYVGTTLPFKVTWDTAYWNAEETSSQGIEGISITTDQGAFGRILSAATGAGAEFGVDECLASQISGWQTDLPDLTQLTPTAAQELAFPAGTEPVYASGTFTFDDGSTATLINAAGCLELGAGAGFLIMSVQIFEPVYADNAAAFNEVLGSIELGDIGGGGQVGLGGRSHGAVTALEASSRQRVERLDAVHRGRRPIG